MRSETFEALIRGLESQGISRTEIAQRSGVSRTTVWRLAEGVVTEPSWTTGNRIEKLFSSAVSPVKQKML
jgi:transcriptional regulator with XRE-family HTH domain